MGWIQGLPPETNGYVNRLGIALIVFGLTEVLGIGILSRYQDLFFEPNPVYGGTFIAVGIVMYTGTKVVAHRTETTDASGS